MKASKETHVDTESVGGDTPGQTEASLFGLELTLSTSEI